MKVEHHSLYIMRAIFATAIGLLTGTVVGSSIGPGGGLFAIGITFWVTIAILAVLGGSGGMNWLAAIALGMCTGWLVGAVLFKDNIALFFSTVIATYYFLTVLT